MSEIIYDITELDLLGDTDLLVQICLRLDRPYTGQKEQQALADTAAAAQALLDQYATDLAAAGFADLAEQVKGVLQA